MRAGFICLVLSCPLAFACGDDGTDTTDTPTEDMDTPTEDMGTTAEDMGTTAEDMGTTADDMGPIPDDLGGPPEDMGSSGAAEAFCADFDAICGYDATNPDRYDDAAACLAYYEGASTACIGCIEPHLMNADTMGLAHCPHAMGEGPCASPCAAP